MTGVYLFSAKIEIIGINPFVFVPDDILNSIFVQANKNKGHIPIKGTVNGNPYQQTLVKYSGEWRLYINTIMLKNSPKRIGEMIELSVMFDPAERVVDLHPKFEQALNENKEARASLESLRPSLKHEIIKYISSLKTEESIDKNVKKAIDYLMGQGKFLIRYLSKK